MSTAGAALRQRLRSRAPLRGLVLKPPCVAEVELAAGAVDLIVLDAEHGPRDDLELLHHLRAADAADVAVLVRVPGIDPAAILAALDGGAAGVVVPHVRSVADARACVRFARYPPEGERGWARSTRAARYGRVDAAAHHAAARSTCVVVQLEDPEAVAAAPDIAAVDGIDALFPGAADLAAVLGVPQASGSEPRVRAGVDAVLAAAAGAGVGGVVVAGDADEAAALRDRGATTVLAVGTTLVAQAFDAFAQWSAEDAAGSRVAAGPLVLLPGMLGTAEAWAPVAARLGPGWRPLHARIDLDDAVGEMADSVLAAAPERFVLAGHSLGGIVGLEVLRRAPERVLGAVLVASSARGPTEAQQAAWAALADRVHGGEILAIADAQPDVLLGPASRGDAGLRSLVAGMARRVGADGLLAQLRAQGGRIDLGPALGAVRCPVLVVSGADDDVCPVALQEELAAGIPGAAHVVLEGVGHLPMLEAPDALARAIAEWAAA